MWEIFLLKDRKCWKKLGYSDIILKTTLIFLQLLQKAIITPDFEKNYCVPPYSESKHQLQKKRRVSIVTLII